MNKIAIIGTAGVPASYGGFETLADNLVRYHFTKVHHSIIVVYCSFFNYKTRPRKYLSARLVYLPLPSNGVFSVLYDMLSLIMASISGTRTILLLGVSGAIILPVIRRFSSVKIITNIDGLEWRRSKWGRFARIFLRYSERLAVENSDIIISDNVAISEYVLSMYGLESPVITYGGDHAVNVAEKEFNAVKFLSNDYALTICRIEPENNIEMILDAFSFVSSTDIVVVGNWQNGKYGKRVYEKYKDKKNIHLLDPIYDLGLLKTLRMNSAYYIHGHSAGGTNPSLVEAMHFGKPIIAYDCEFNRITTEYSALYFSSADDIVRIFNSFDDKKSHAVGKKMLFIARRKYTWDIVSSDYYSLFDRPDTA